MISVKVLFTLIKWSRKSVLNGMEGWWMHCFSGINIWIGMNCLPVINNFFVCRRRIRQFTNPKGEGKDRILGDNSKRILPDNMQNISPRDSEQYGHAWRLEPLFEHLLKSFQQTTQPEFDQSINDHICKFRGKSLMWQYMTSKSIRWSFKFWFYCGSHSRHLYKLDLYLGNKGNNQSWSTSCIVTL